MRILLTNKIFMILVIIMLAFACLCSFSTKIIENGDEDGSFSGMVLKNTDIGCPLPPEKISEDQLVGIWRDLYTQINTGSKIILSEDMTYKYTYIDPYIDFTYENNNGYRWYVEFTDDGYPLLHMENMVFCNSELSVCMGKEPLEGKWDLLGNHCTGELIYQKYETIFIIMGKYENTTLDIPGDIVLTTLSYDPDMNPEYLIPDLP